MATTTALCLAATAFDPAELYIAIACAADGTGAISSFEERYVAPAWGALHRYGLTFDEQDEVRQRLRVRLLVHKRDGAPVILHCAGRGRLGGLVRVSLVREALRLRGGRSHLDIHEHHLRDDNEDQAIVAGEHGALLKGAFEQTVPTLDVRSRSLLRLHYVCGVSGSQIGAMYGVHRATAARWIATARSALLEGVQRTLVESAPELATWSPRRLRDLVHSGLDLSLSRLFAE